MKRAAGRIRRTHSRPRGLDGDVYVYAYADVEPLIGAIAIIGDFEILRAAIHSQWRPNPRGQGITGSRLTPGCNAGLRKF